MLKFLLNIPNSIRNYVRGVRWELSQMEWISRGAVMRYTVMVIVSVIVFTAAIYTIDQFFVIIRNLLLTPAI